VNRHANAVTVVLADAARTAVAAPEPERLDEPAPAEPKHADRQQLQQTNRDD
jgi:hypothetical protein